jgi:hypothetical protein
LDKYQFLEIPDGSESQGTDFTIEDRQLHHFSASIGRSRQNGAIGNMQLHRL